MEPVTLSGIDDLKGADKHLLRRFGNEYHEKFVNMLDNEVGVKIRTKMLSKTGKSHQYNVHVHVSGPGGNFESEETEWDLKRVLHAVFKNVERQIEHKLAR